MLSDTLVNLIKSIIGTPANEYESIALYVVACFIFILIVKLIYDLISYLTGLNR